MFRSRVLFLSMVVSTSVICRAFSTQTPLFGTDAESYNFKWPIRKVAIIGAGPGGMIAYREFTQAGFDVHVFERDSHPGGNWHYTEEVPDQAPIPNAEISVGDYTPSRPPEGAMLPYEEHYYDTKAEEILRTHRAPKPIWATLQATAPAVTSSEGEPRALVGFLPVPIPTHALEIPEFPWPVGTPWELSHELLTRYFHAFTSHHGVNSNDNNPRISYNTHVEFVDKRLDDKGKEAGWTLTLKELVKTGPSSVKAVWNCADFDAVVIATGRFNAPNMPNIPGLSKWGEIFPDQIIHSRQYRRREHFANQTVLVVGAGASGYKICRDIHTFALKVYQSVRKRSNSATVTEFNPEFWFRTLPLNVSIIPEIKCFLPPTQDMHTSQIELVNGTIITGIDSIILATGYLYSFPFLPQYHNSSIRKNETGLPYLPQPLVTDGTHIRNLYLDVFYIEEPTLGFVNMNVGIPTFIYAEYIAVALSKVWSNKAKLPAKPHLWCWKQKHVEDRGGYTKLYQFQNSERTNGMIRFFVGWLNEAAAKYGGCQVAGVDPDYAEITQIWARVQLGIGFDADTLVVDKETADFVYNDYW